VTRGTGYPAKRLEPVDVNKIVRAVQRSSYGLTHVDAIRVASKTIGGLYDGATTRELDTISIDTAASLIAEEPQYSRLACCWPHRQGSLGAESSLVFASRPLWPSTTGPFHSEDATEALHALAYLPVSARPVWVVAPAAPEDGKNGLPDPVENVRGRGFRLLPSLRLSAEPHF